MTKQVPEHKIIFSSAPKHPYCVLIPVINEGARIKNLLARMAHGNIKDSADIIIVDGGSTDGSLEQSDLQRLGVAAVLEKTGVGKLSAQLRVGYAFALTQGYDGIITIDGNDKDDPEAIVRFIAALKEGVDFVQASRFIKGGVEKNTPRLRRVAVRCIHAPVLSLFSRFRWTDTTQGFRAYSARMLKDERLNIFRDVFMTYELLAYMNYRAPRLGFKCVELPTSRCYPKGEAVPTKISAFGGNIELLLILFATCFGRYNP